MTSQVRIGNIIYKTSNFVLNQSLQVRYTQQSILGLENHTKAQLRHRLYIITHLINLMGQQIIMASSTPLAYLIIALICYQALPSSIPSVATGVITPIPTFSGLQTNSVSTTTVTFTSALTAQPGVALQAGISLISFETIISIEFIFNSSIDLASLSSLKVSATPFNTTYFKLLRFHYIVSQHATIDILKGCFYCGNMTGTGPRSQNFTNLSTTLTPISNLVFTTTISGLKLTNWQGSYYSATAVSYNVGLPSIVVQISTDEQNFLEWMCVTIISYNKFAAQYEIYFRNSAVLSYASGTSVIPPYQTYFLFDNVMFFGISSIKLNFLLASDHKFDISTYASSNPTVLTTNRNLENLVFEQFFVMALACGGVVDTAALSCLPSCPPRYIVNALSFCDFCDSNNGHCLTCDATQCLTCDSAIPTYRFLDGAICSCMPLYYDLNGACVLCSTAISNCDTCSSSSSCLTCKSPFTMSGGKCICSPGLYLVNGICSQLMGCTSINNITTGVYCIECSSSLNFFLASNQTCICVNYTLYDPSIGKCRGICGDGKALDNICDDGDAVDDNGCANDCTITPGYDCANPGDNVPSVCVLKRSFTGEYKYALKDANTNTAILHISISPDDPSLSLMDFSKLIKSSISSTSISATYSNGQLVVLLTYTQSIQKTDQSLTISFDNLLISAPAITLAINPSGINYKLAFNPLEKFNSIVSIMATLQGVLALVVALASSVLGYKLIGFEILLPVQLVYLSLSCLNQPASALGSLRTLSYSTGYNQLKAFNLNDNLSLTPGLMSMQRNDQFLTNFNFTAIPFLLTVVLAFILRPGSKEKESTAEKVNNIRKKAKGHQAGKQQKKETEDCKDNKVKDIQASPKVQDKCEKIYLFLVDRIVIVLWVSLIQNSIFSFAIQMLTLDSNVFLPKALNASAAALFFILEMMCIVFLVMKLNEKDGCKVEFHSRSKEYPIYLIVSYTICTIVLSSSFFDSASLYLLLAAQVFPVILVLKIRPYGPLLSLNTLTALYCQLIPIASSIILFLSFSVTDGFLTSILSFTILTLILLGETLSIFRLIYRLRKSYLKQKQQQEGLKAQKEDAELRSIAHESIKQTVLNTKEQIIIDWSNHKDQEFELNKGEVPKKKLAQLDLNSDEEPEEEQEDELAMIKLRLRKELLSKRAPS